MTLQQISAPRKSLSRRLIYLLISLSAGTVGLTVIVAWSTVDYATHILDPITEAQVEMRYEILNAHLMCEKVMADEHAASPDSIGNCYDTAQALIGRIKALVAKDWLRRTTQDIAIPEFEKTLGQLRVLSAQKVALHAKGQKNDTLDDAYNDVLNSFRQRLNAWDVSLNSAIFSHLQVFAYIQIVLLLVCVIAAVGIGAIIRRVTRQRAEAMDALQKSIREVNETCQKLASSEQQLKAANQQLRANEQQLKSANQQLHANEQQLRASNQQLRANEQQIRAANQQLKANEQCLHVYQKAVEHAEDLIAAVNSSYEIIFVNAAYENYHALPRREIAGTTLESIVGPEEFQKTVKPHLDRCLSGERIQYETKRSFKGKDERTLIVYYYPLLGKQPRDTVVITVLRDITDQRRMDEEREKVQRLESLGLLAGGIAHDFNNLLTGFFGYVSLARTMMEEDSPAAGYLNNALSAFGRAGDLTRQLLTFAKGGTPVKKPMHIEKLLKEAATFSLSGSNVRPNIVIDDSLWPVDIDEGQIHQVISNIVINARQAMPEGGSLNVRASNCILGVNDVPQLPQGQYVAVGIRDQGIGIPAQHLDKIFEPFFTTKQKGSGLGLTLSFSIIKKHGGHITVSSGAGEGTLFTFYLPAMTRTVLESGGTIEEVTLSRGSGLVLVMDDEELIRTLLSRILEQQGYQVLTAHDGRSTIELYRKTIAQKQNIRVAILDLTIPGGMGGKETVKHLKDIDPDVNAIASTGYSDDPIISDPAAYGFAAFVTKPFHINDLLRTIQAVVSAS
jgi:PAS domain S-box-containing protein